MSQDLFQAPDYYQLDELLTEENILVRNAAREWVKRAVSPIIEEAAQNAKFPKSIISGLAEIGAFGPYIPEEYGGSVRKMNKSDWWKGSDAWDPAVK